LIRKEPKIIKGLSEASSVSSELQRNIEIIPIANQFALKACRKLSVLIFAMVYADTYLKCL
jgi:hypothetical protein